MSYDPSVCDTQLTQKGLTPICEVADSAQFHCDSIMETQPYHTMCAGEDIYFPVPVTACYNSQSTAWAYFPNGQIISGCMALKAKDSNWDLSQCFCCCSCFANDTLVGVPDGVRPIDNIAVGDLVLAGAKASDGTVTWTPEAVGFSQGTGPGGQQPSMVYLVLEDGSDVICSCDQPFLTPDGTFVLAKAIAPGTVLVARDGSPAAVHLASIGSYTGGVHHIATKVPWTGQPDGHLIDAGGLVAGDFVLQLHFAELEDHHKADPAGELPHLGTAAYDEQHGAAAVDDVRVEFDVAGEAGPGSGPLVRTFAHGTFRTYTRGADAVPYGAQALLTDAQAADVLANGTFAPISNTIGKGFFQIIATQLAGFYPDVDFYYEALAMTPQVFAFEAYGRKIVQVNGGLTRLKGFLYEGMATAMGHGVGSLVGGPPLNAAGFPAVGQADTYGFGVVARQMWTGQPYLTNALAAMEQWQALFALVSPAHAQGNPKDVLDDPGLACRYQNIQTAIGGGGLEACAGGQPLPPLVLEQATAGRGGAVDLVFSVGVAPGAGSDPASYSLDGGATVTTATVNTRTNFAVTLETDVEPGKTYQLTVRNLESYLGGPLTPDPTTTSFTVPKAT